MIQPVQNRADLLEALEQVRRAGAGPATNWFATPERIERWIGRNSLFCLPGDRALLILRRDRGFHRVYHSAADLEALSAVLRSLSGPLNAEDVLIADLVGRPQDLEPVIGIYRENGFSEHNCLVRMTRTAAPEEVAEIEPDVEFAGPADVESVVAFLCHLLDPYTDQIPDEDEIREAVALGKLVMVRRDDSLGGLLLFETVGVTSHLRYWYVDDTVRNRGIGARLIRHFFRLTRSSRRWILWVASDNSDAIAKYRHYGFRPDALVDRIMIGRR
ncbi:MAG: GNAT family N-acetyltransferase [Bryobacteraceae bacterium]